MHTSWSGIRTELVSVFVLLPHQLESVFRFGEHCCSFKSKLLWLLHFHATLLMYYSKCVHDWESCDVKRIFIKVRYYAINVKANLLCVCMYGGFFWSSAWRQSGGRKSRIDQKITNRILLLVVLSPDAHNCLFRQFSFLWRKPHVENSPSYMTFPSAS